MTKIPVSGKNIAFMTFKWNASVEARFQERLRQQSVQGYKLVSLLGLTLFPSFGVLDWFTQREHFRQLFEIRIIASLFFLVVYLGARSRNVKRSPDWHIVMIYTFATLSTTAMAVVTGGYQSPYYAGTCLVILTATLVMPWAPKKMAALSAWLCAIYTFCILFHDNFVISRPAILANNLIFLYATAFIGVAASCLYDRLRRESFAQYTAAEEARDSIEQSVRILSRELGDESSDVVTLSREIAEQKTKLQSSIRYAELAKNEAVNALHLRDEFISIASHELKTPITTISLQNQMFKKLIAKSTFPVEKIDQYNHALARSEAQVKRMSRLIDDMLDLSQI